MFRRSRGRKKTPVRWLEDRPFEGLSSVASSAGVIPTFTLQFTNEVNQRTWEPSNVTAQFGTGVGDPTKVMFETPRSQLTQQPGWRMMRDVGEWTIALKQEPKGLEDHDAAAIVLVSVGLCVLNLDETGNATNESDYVLGPAAVPETDASIADTQESEGAPWIWRRRWILQNYAAGYGGASSAYGFTSWNYTVQAAAAGLPTGFGYGMAPPCTNLYHSVHLGAHFDIKRHVTLKEDQVLAWRMHAIDMQGATNSAIRLLFNRNHRVLIARAGRPFRERK